MNYDLERWHSLLNTPIIFWGWRHDENSTMCYEFETIRRGIASLGLRTTWVRADETPPHLGKKRVIFLGQTQGSGEQLEYWKVTNEADILIHHNTESRRGPGIHIQWYFMDGCVVDGDAKILPYPCDLFPSEIESEITHDILSAKENSLYFVGSDYGGMLGPQHQEISALAGRYDLAHCFEQNQDQKDIHKKYLAARFAPVPQLPNIGAFLPSRLIKAMARGCIPIFTSPYLPALIGERGAKGCIFARTWEQVFEKIRNTDKETMAWMARANLEYARQNSVFHFLDTLTSPEPTEYELFIKQNLNNARQITAL